MCFVITDEIFPIKSLKSLSNTKLDVLVWAISPSCHDFLSQETELVFVKTHIIHVLAETTSEAYSSTCVYFAGYIRNIYIFTLVKRRARPIFTTG